MDRSLLIANISFIATSTWIALGSSLGLALILCLVAPLLSTSADENIERWRIWRLRGLGAGLALGALAGSFFAFFVGADRVSPATGLIVLLAVAGALVGQAVAGATAGAMRREQSDRRVGHSHAVSIRDYVSSLVLWAARIAVLAATVALALRYVLAAFTSPQEFPTTLLFPAFLVFPALLVLLMNEVGVRIVVSRPTSAGSVDALRQQDLQRVHIARDGVGAALCLGVLAFIVSVLPLIALISSQAEVLVLASSAITAVIGYAAVIYVVISVVLSFREKVLPSPKNHRSSDLSEASR